MAVLTLLAGCAGTGPGAGTGAGAAGALPTDRTFVSTSVTEGGKPRPLVGDTRIELQFRPDGLLIAQAGCNSMQGAARADGRTLVVEELATSARGCPADLHAQDQWLSRLLSARPDWSLAGTDLVLTGGGAELRFVEHAAVPASQLTGVKWSLDTVVAANTASSVPADVEATITIADDGRVTGSTGCNGFGARATVTGDRLTVGQVVSTKKACEGAAGELERSVLKVLDQPLTWRIEGDRLVLTAPDGSGLQLTR